MKNIINCESPQKLITSETIKGRNFPMQKEAMIYGRISSKDQEKGEGEKIQIEGGKRYADQHGFNVVGIYFDRAVSGKDGLNQEKDLGRLMRDAKGGQTILVHIFDRFGRQDSIDLLYFLNHSFIQKNVSILEWSTGELFTKENWEDMSKRFSAFVKSTVSNEENKRKIERQQRNWQGKRENAKSKPLTATCPSWIKAIVALENGKKVTKGFELIPDHASIVKRIFDMSFNGMGNQAITRLLNREGVKGIGGVDSWHTSVVDRILRNRAVLGEFQPMKCVKKDGKKRREPVGEPIKNYYPRVTGITEAMFTSVQLKRKQRTSGGRRDVNGTISNLFTSICYCGFCQAKMIYTQKGSKGLVCDSAKRATGCRHVGYPYQEFETSFLTYVRELNLSDILNSTPDNTKLNVQIEQCRAAIDATQTKINNLGEAIANGKGKSLMAMVDNLESEMELQNHNLKELIARQTASHVEVIKVNELKALIAKAQNTKAENINETRMALREAIRSMVTKIEVFPYELVTPIKRSELSWKELRETTKAGYLIDSEYQTVERCYRVWFKNEDSYREIFSHPNRVFSAKGLKAA